MKAVNQEVSGNAEQVAAGESINQSVTHDNRINIRLDLSGKVADQFIVQGGMHIYLQLGRDGRD